jgi:hypothetical protein
MGAAPMGIPGWPELAFWTASMARVRRVLIHNWSSSPKRVIVVFSCDPFDVKELSIIIASQGFFV